jgi:hypothetical protein
MIVLFYLHSSGNGIKKKKTQRREINYRVIKKDCLSWQSN